MDGMVEEADATAAVDMAGYHLDEGRDVAVDLHKRLHAAHQPTAHITSHGSNTTASDAEEGWIDRAPSDPDLWLDSLRR